MLDNNNTMTNYSLIISKVNHYDKVDVSRLPLSVCQQAENYNGLRRSQYLTGRALLAELLFQKQAILQLPDIVLIEKGRPVFVDRSLPDFNISHSGDHIMVVLAKSGTQVGLDIEVDRPRNRLLALAKHSLSENEYQWLSELPSDRQVAGFWHLWTLRESILKLTGEGVWQMKQLTIFPRQKKISTPFTDTLFSLTGQIDSIYWAISSNHPIHLCDLELFRIESNLTEIIPVTIPTMIKYDVIKREEIDYK